MAATPWGGANLKPKGLKIGFDGFDLSGHRAPFKPRGQGMCGGQDFFPFWRYLYVYIYVYKVFHSLYKAGKQKHVPEIGNRVFSTPFSAAMMLVDTVSSVFALLTPIPRCVVGMFLQEAAWRARKKLRVDCKIFLFKWSKNDTDCKNFLVQISTPHLQYCALCAPRRFNLEKAHIILDEMVLDGCIVDTNKAIVILLSCRFYGRLCGSCWKNRQQFWIRCTCWRSTQVDMPFKKISVGRVGVLRVFLADSSQPDFQLFATWMTLSNQFCCKKNLSLLVSTQHGRCLFGITLLEMSAVLTQTVSPLLPRSILSISLQWLQLKRPWIGIGDYIWLDRICLSNQVLS